MAKKPGIVYGELLMNLIYINKSLQRNRTITHSEITRSREVLAVLVERHRHDPIRRVERLLDAVAVVNVDVDVKNALVVLEQLEDTEHNVVDVAEAGRLRLLGVVEAAAPVDADLRRLLVELDGCSHRAARRQLAELVEAVENGAVLADVDWREK